MLVGVTLYPAITILWRALYRALGLTGAGLLQPPLRALRDLSQANKLLVWTSQVKPFLKGTVSRDFIPPTPILSDKTNPSGLLIGMLKYFRIWLRFHPSPCVPHTVYCIVYTGAHLEAPGVFHLYRNYC